MILRALFISLIRLDCGGGGVAMGCNADSDQKRAPSTSGGLRRVTAAVKGHVSQERVSSERVYRLENLSG